jgi:hypothetical protein
MLLPLVRAGLDPAVVIPPSMETDIMSKQSIGKKKGGADISSDVFYNISSSESATLEPWSSKLAGVGKPDKEGGALVIPAKATSQLAIVASSKDPVATKHCQGKELPMRAAKLKQLASTSLSDLKPTHSQTKNDSTVEDEDDDIHEAVSSDPNYYEVSDIH